MGRAPLDSAPGAFIAELRHDTFEIHSDDILGRFREVISDPLNLLIHRVPLAGLVEKNEVYLHNGNIVPLDGAGAYYGQFIQLLVLNRGVHEPLEEYAFQELLKNLPKHR